jgi:hypothetical protein
MLKPLLLILGVALAGNAAAQYKWTDKNGKVQYGDTPPSGANASAVRPPVRNADDAGEAKKEEARKTPLTPAEQDAEFRKRRAEGEKEREKQAQAERDAQDKSENCARAKEALRVYEAGGRVARIDTKGERYFLDDAQIAQEAARARQAVQQWCG